MKVTVPLLRDLVMLALGSGGMAHELFLVPTPDMIRVSVSIALLLGPAALNSWWLRRADPVTPTAVSSSPSPSSPPSSGS